MTQHKELFDKLRIASATDNRNRPNDVLFAAIAITLLEATFDHLNRITIALGQIALAQQRNLK